MLHSSTFRFTLKFTLHLFWDSIENPEVTVFDNIKLYMATPPSILQNRCRASLQLNCFPRKDLQTLPVLRVPFQGKNKASTMLRDNPQSCSSSVISRYHIKVFFEAGQEKNQVNQPIFDSDNPAEYSGGKACPYLIGGPAICSKNGVASSIITHHLSLIIYMAGIQCF